MSIEERRPVVTVFYRRTRRKTVLESTAILNSRKWALLELFPNKVAGEIYLYPKCPIFAPT